MDGRRLPLVGPPKALLPLWLPRVRRRLGLTPAVERQLLAISVRQIHRRLAPTAGSSPGASTAAPNLGPSSSTTSRCGPIAGRSPPPGFSEIDLVSHSGTSADGEHIHSLNLTDIQSTWVETVAVLGKHAAGMQQALETIQRALPFRLRGIDSDNGSEFINAPLYDYCQAHEIQFTRGRPYKKDDNAHIEQKNWTHVRKLLGYVRYDSPAALAAINDLYRHELRLFQNLVLGLRKARPATTAACPPVRRPRPRNVSPFASGA